MQNALHDATRRGIQNVPLIAPARRPIKASDSNRTVKSEYLVFHKETTGQTEPRERLTNWKRKFKKGGYLMKTTTKSKGRIPVLLSILCAGLVGTFLGGCAESPYVRTTTVIIRTDITTDTRTIIHTRIPITRRPMILRSCAQASVITMPMVRATTKPGPFTATGNNLRPAVG